MGVCERVAVRFQGLLEGAHAVPSIEREKRIDEKMGSRGSGQLIGDLKSCRLGVCVEGEQGSIRQID